MLTEMLDDMDQKRLTIMEGFAALLTATADPSYCGTIGAEVKVHRGEIKDARFPQNQSVNFQAATDDLRSTLRAVSN